MLKTKFAIVRTVGDQKYVLKVFEDNENGREEAIAFGEEAAKGNAEGTISCVRACFDEQNRMMRNEYRVYEVWRPNKLK